MVWILIFLSAGLGHIIDRTTANLGPKFHGYELRPTKEALKVSPLAASAYQYPFMGLVTDYKKQCGGCFVTHNVVVTAAHCLGSDTQYMLANFNVLLHRYQLNVPLESDGASKFNVTHAFVHPSYDISYEAAAPHDVAVLVVNNPQRMFDGVDLDATVRIDRGKYSAVNEGARLLGWGTTSDELISANDTSAKPTVIMKEMNLIIRPAANCTYREFEKGYSLCAQGVTDDEIPCKGDSGGPLMHLPQGNGDSRYTFVGIVSFGSTNCTLNTVFARVASYSDFIIDKVRRFSPRSPVASTTPAPPPAMAAVPGMTPRPQGDKPSPGTPLTPPKPSVTHNRNRDKKPKRRLAGPKQERDMAATARTIPDKESPSPATPTVHTLAVTTQGGHDPITVTYNVPPKETDLNVMDTKITEILLDLQRQEPLPSNSRVGALNSAFPDLEDITVAYYRPDPTTTASQPRPTLVRPPSVRPPPGLRIDSMRDEIKNDVKRSMGDM